MFNLYNKLFDLLNQKPSLGNKSVTPNVEALNRGNFKQKYIKLNNIVGSRVRSKNGCLNCKRRKYVWQQNKIMKSYHTDQKNNN